MGDLWYDPSWYTSWIRSLLYDAEEEMVGIIVWDEYHRRWAVHVQWEDASDRIQDRVGETPGDLVVAAVFHTHPHTSYGDAVTTRGDPSLDDLLLYIRHLIKHGHRTHLVFAKEGIFRMSYTGAIPSALEAEAAVDQLRRYPQWEKTGCFDSIDAGRRCETLTRWVRTHWGTGFSMRFLEYSSPHKLTP